MQMKWCTLDTLFQKLTGHPSNPYYKQRTRVVRLSCRIQWLRLSPQNSGSGFLHLQDESSRVLGNSMREMKTILVLEDNGERIAAFQKAVAALGDGFELRVWRDAPSMCTECVKYFPTAALISLDHDLNPVPGATVDPGTAFAVAKFIGCFRP